VAGAAIQRLFVSCYSKNMPANREAAAYLRGPYIGVARNADNAFEIVRILVVGVDTATGIQAVTFQAAAAARVNSIRTFAAAFWMAVPLSCIEWLPAVSPSSGVRTFALAFTMGNLSEGADLFGYRRSIPGLCRLR
jgi:hypothetical protein